MCYLKILKLYDKDFALSVIIFCVFNVVCFVPPSIFQTANILISFSSCPRFSKCRKKQVEFEKYMFSYLLYLIKFLTPTAV